MEQASSNVKSATRDAKIATLDTNFKLGLSLGDGASFSRFAGSIRADFDSTKRSGRALSDSAFDADIATIR